MPSFRFLSAVALGAMLLAPLGASAQALPGTTPIPAAQRHHGNRFVVAVRSLNLTADQRRRVDELVAANRTASRNADQATKRANRRQLHAQIESLLTPAQRAQLHAKLHRPR